jgi:transposase-like protein
MKCPVCRSKDVQRSHSRSSREKLYRYLLFRHYYRCHACGWRGSVSSLTLQSVLGVAAKKKGMILAVLAAILALILLEVYLLFEAAEYL